MSELAKYYSSNPDTVLSVCRNTGRAEDGVVFPGIEPLVGAYTYVGRSSIIEAVAELYDSTPAEVKRLLTGGTPAQQVKLKTAEADASYWERMYNEMKTNVLNVIYPPTADLEDTGS